MYHFTDDQIRVLFINANVYERKLNALSINRKDLDSANLSVLRRTEQIVREYEDIFFLLDIEDQYIEFKNEWKEENPNW